MGDDFKTLGDLLPNNEEQTAYVVCLDCGHQYTELLRVRPGSCPHCSSTTNRDQYDALVAGSARTPELQDHPRAEAIAQGREPALGGFSDVRWPDVDFSLLVNGE